MLYTTLLLEDYNPPDALLNDMRLFNIVLASIAFLVMIFLLGKPRWKTLSTSGKLVFLALLNSCFTAVYGSLEVLYSDTELRVPLVTITMTWILVAGYVAFREERAKNRPKG
jgi:uncharacterized membrane protein